MIVNFYTTTDDPKTVSKTLTQIASVDCVVNTPLSVEDPVLHMVQDSGYILQNVNYAYIDEFKRYYFLEPMEYDGKVERLQLHTDVLKTFENQIRALNATVERTADRSKGDGYLVDSEYLAKAYKDIRTYDFSGNAIDTFSTVLMTV